MINATMINRLMRAVILVAALAVAVVGGLVLPASAEPQQADDAVVNGPKQVVVGQGITISGTGWNSPSGGGSVIAVKLDDGSIERKTPIADPPTKMELADDVFAVVRADADGNFKATVDFPTTATATKTWAAGSKGSLRLLTGKLLDGDKVRSVEVPFEVVSGPRSTPSPAAPAPPANSAPARPTPTATPTQSVEASPAPDSDETAKVRLLPQVEPTTSTAPRVTAAGSCSDKTTVKLTGESTSGGKPAAPLGGSLTLSGTGWCTKDGKSGSTIAVKIDDGAFSRLDSSLHQNRTIWQIIKVGNDGSFTATVKVPGANETTPALKTGTHMLRLLTGTLGKGDNVRTLPEPGDKNLDFVATGGGSSSSPSATTTTSPTDNSSTTSNNSSTTSTTSTNGTSGKLAATGGSRTSVLVLGLVLIVVGIWFIRFDTVQDELARKDS